MKILNKNIIIFVFVTFIICIPFLMNAQGIVPCGNGNDECEVSDIVALAKNLMDWFILISVVVAALLFLNAGVLYIMSPSNPSNIARAHRLFLSTLVGMVVVLCSWMIINLVMTTLYGGAGTWGSWFSILG